MEERQALRIDYAHGAVPGTAFVIDEPFPIPQHAPRVPSAVGTASGLSGGATAGGVGLPSSGTWSKPPHLPPLQLPPLQLQPPIQRIDEPAWRGRDWQSQQHSQSLFPDSGRFRREDGAAKRPNGSYMQGPFRGRGGGRGGRLDAAVEDVSGVPFRRRVEMGGLQGRNFAGRQRGGPAGGRGRRGGQNETDSFRRGRERGQPQRKPMNRGMRGDARGAPRGRERGFGGQGPEELRNRGPPDAPFTQEKTITQKPVNKQATQSKAVTSQKPPQGKRPPVNKFRNRVPSPNVTRSSPTPPTGAKNNSTGGKPMQSAARTEHKPATGIAKVSSSSEAKSKSPRKDSVRKSSPARTASKKRSPRKSSSKPRSPKKSSRTRSPGGRRSSRPRSSSKSQSRRSRSRSRRKLRSRSHSPQRHRSRSGSSHRSRCSLITRSPYKPSSLLHGQVEGYGIKVVGFPVLVLDCHIQDELYHKFKRHGQVVSIDVYSCAEARFAVVTYQLPTERESALGALNDETFFGRSVKIETWDSSASRTDMPFWENNASYGPLDERADEFHPRATKILFVGNLDKTLTREDLSTVFNRYGEVLGIDLKKMAGLPNRFAFVQYIDIAGVCRAIKGMDGELLRSTRLRLGFGRSKPTNCVWVDGLPGTLTEAQLTAHFSAHGTVLKLSFDSVKGVALVFFKTVEQAEAALQEARGQTVGGNRIKVDFANARSQSAFYRVLEPGPEDGVDVEPEEKPAASAQVFKSSDIEAGDVLRKVLLV